MSTNAERSANALAAAAARQVAAQVAHTAASDLTPADLVKLDGIETGATANDTNANLRARSSHTGSQLASTISDFAASVLATVLTGLSLATGTAITAADTVLSAMGKLQKQITDVIASVALKAPLLDPVFTVKVKAPNFLTDSGSASALTGVATTVFTLPTGTLATYIVSGNLGGSADVTNFSALAVVLLDFGTARIALQNNGALLTITLSGLNIQLTQSSGLTQTVFATLTRTG